MPDNQFINLEELSKTTQALLSKINEQSNLKVNKNNVKSELSEGTKIGSIEGINFYAPEIDTSNLATHDDLDNFSDALASVAYTGNYNDLNDTPSLATIATSGSYNDLSDTPKLPIIIITPSRYTPYSAKIMGTSLSLAQVYPSVGSGQSGIVYFYINGGASITTSGNFSITLNNSTWTVSVLDKAGEQDSYSTGIGPGLFYGSFYYERNAYSFTIYRDTLANNALTVKGHTVDSNVPADAVFTDTVYDDTAISSRITTLENAGYQNSTQVNSAIATAIGNINQFEVAIVTNLPTTDIDTHTIYFKSNSSSGNNVYDEYMYINNNWELIGNTAVDLSNYLEKTDIANWAKQANKPTYTAAEVGALPDSTVIPAAQVNSDWDATSGVAQILNKPTIPDVPDWALAATKPTYTADEVGAATSYHTHTLIKSTYGENSSTISANANSSNATISIQAESPSGTIHTDTLTFTGDVGRGVKITGLTTPRTDTEAANKKYVDDSISAISVPTKTSDLTNDSGYLTSYTETDPTVPAWAKAATKPTYTAAEVGALSAQHSSLTTSSGADILRIGKSSYSEGQVGKIQLSNKSDLNGYTTITPKATSDISINLPSTAGTLALTSQIPAAQVQSDWNATTGMGAILNKPTIPAATTVTQTLTSGTKIGEVNGVSLYAPEAGNQGIATETDPIFSASPAAGITSENITAWNAKSNFSGSYNDLSDKPTIPTVPTNISAFTNDSGYLTSYTETDPTVPAWAKAESKPTYTASEVGALPSSTSYVSSFNGATGAITYTAPVTSVNGNTGAVTITAASITAASATHAHGNLTSGGDITTTATIASGDHLIINDESASKITNSSITFGSSTTQYLANNGTWQNAYDDTALAARVTALEQIPWVTYYTGSTTPSNSQGNNGDLYFQTAQ